MSKHRALVPDPLLLVGILVGLLSAVLGLLGGLLLAIFKVITL